MITFITAVDIKNRLIAHLGMDADWVANFPHAILKSNPKASSPEGSGLFNESPCVVIDNATKTSITSGLGPTGVGSNIDNFQLALLIYITATSEDDATKDQIEELTSIATQIIDRYSAEPTGMWYRIGGGRADEAMPIQTDNIYSPAGFRVSITPFNVFRYYIKP